MAILLRPKIEFGDKNFLTRLAQYIRSSKIFLPPILMVSVSENSPKNSASNDIQFFRKTNYGRLRGQYIFKKCSFGSPGKKMRYLENYASMEKS